MLTESTPQMFLQARHGLDEAAWAKAVVELVDEDNIPGIAAGARRPGQREQISAASNQSNRIGTVALAYRMSIAARDSGMVTRGSTGSLVLKACLDAAPRRRMQLDEIFRRQNANGFRKAGAISAAPTGTVVSISG
jgi:hypothetical protein